MKQVQATISAVTSITNNTELIDSSTTTSNLINNFVGNVIDQFTNIISNNNVSNNQIEIITKTG